MDFILSLCTFLRVTLYVGCDAFVTSSTDLLVKKVQNIHSCFHWHGKCNKSPAVARVSRPYSRRTLAACVYSCFEHFVACARNVNVLIYVLLIYLLNFGCNVNFRHLPATIALPIAAKPLQITTRSLLTACWYLPTPNSTVLSPTHYDVLFTHSKSSYRQTTDKQTDGRTTELSNSLIVQVRSAKNPSQNTNIKL